MPEKPGQAVRTFWLAVLLVMEMAGGYAAEKSIQTPSEGLADAQAGRIQTALCKIDLNFKPTADSSFVFDSGDLRIAIRADEPTYYEGNPFQNSTPQSGVYGDVNVSDKFYGIERVLHYALSKGGVPYGKVQVQERITVLYENLLHRPLRPRAFDSKPFLIGKDGTFQDRQTMGHFDIPWPDNALQILKQELILDGELVAVIYIMRTKKEIRIVGYSVPPLMPNFPDSSSAKHQSTRWEEMNLKRPLLPLAGLLNRNGTRPVLVTPNESLTKVPKGRQQWLQLKLPKNSSFITLCIVSICRFQTLSRTAARYRKQALSHRKTHGFSRDIPKSCKPKSTRNS